MKLFLGLLPDFNVVCIIKIAFGQSYLEECKEWFAEYTNPIK
jgi:hypothetical protein